MRSTEYSHEADNRAEIPARRVGRGRCLFVAGVFVCGLSAVCDAFGVDRGISVWESNRTATTRPSSSISKYTRPITGWGCAMKLAGRLIGKVKCEAGIISISTASAGGRTRQNCSLDETPRPEVISQPITRLARNAEIVSKGRPQAVYNANRIARANKLGAALPYERLRTFDAASSADKTWYSAWRSRSAKFANLHEVGGCCDTFRRVSGSAVKAARTSKLVGTITPRLIRPVDLPCAYSVRSPWAWSEKRPSYFSGGTRRENA